MYKYLAKTVFVGKSVIYLPSCHSTNQVADEMLGTKDLQEGTIIITNNQTAGRGQRGNQWEAAPGQNLTLTVLLKPLFLPVAKQFYLNMAVALAVRKTLANYVENCVVKWPNDVLSGRKKLAGILIQNFVNNQGMHRSLVGIGLNVNQESFSAPNAASIRSLTGNKIDLQDVMKFLAYSLEEYYDLLKSGDIERIKSEYYTHLFLLGQSATFKAEHEFKGIMKGVTEEGRLIIDCEGEELIFATKEVAYVY